MELFRDYLDVLCRSRGVQYAELARRVGVTKSYIGQLVHGHSKPPPRERCEQIAEALELAPDERRRLVDLAIRERASLETLVKLEALDSDVRVLRSASAELLGSLAERDEGPPAAIADLLEWDEPLAEASSRRLARGLAALAGAFRESPPELEASEGGVPLRPPVPLIGHVAAGETTIAFTDAGLPVGASLPGEDGIPRWPGLGDHAYALRITGESMMPLCPPGTTIVVDPDRTPRGGEPAICQTTEGKSYFKIVHFEPGSSLRLASTNPEAGPDIVLKRSELRRLQKVVATLYP